MVAAFYGLCLCKQASGGRPHWARIPAFDSSIKKDDETPLKLGYYPFSLFLSRFFFETPIESYGGPSGSRMQMHIVFAPVDEKKKKIDDYGFKCKKCHKKFALYCSSVCCSSSLDQPPSDVLDLTPQQDTHAAAETPKSVVQKNRPPKTAGKKRARVE